MEDNSIERKYILESGHTKINSRHRFGIHIIIITLLLGDNFGDFFTHPVTTSLLMNLHSYTTTRN